LKKESLNQIKHSKKLFNNLLYPKHVVAGGRGC